MEVADSLDRESIAQIEFAVGQLSIADAAVVNNVADMQLSAIIPNDISTWGKTLSGNDRLKIADKANQEAKTDSANASRYRSLAVKAVLNKMKK